jgi:DNA polymerase-1
MRIEKEIITTESRLLQVLTKLVPYEIVFDTESTGLVYSSLLLGTSFYSPEFNTAYWVATNYFFEQGISVEAIARVMNQFTFKSIFHNAKYDFTVFARNKVDLEVFDLVDDTILLIHLHDPELLKKMEERIKLDFGVKKKTFKEIVGKNWDRIDWNKDVIRFEGDTGCFTFEQLADYACSDVYWTYRLREYYLPKVLADTRLYKVYTDIELPLVPVLCEMYMQGVNIRPEVLTAMDGVLLSEIERTKESIFKQCGVVFNMNSPQQKADVLYNTLGYPVLGYTKTGNPSTDASTLDQLADMDYDVCVTMREYSTLQKLYSGYVNGIPSLLDYDGRLRGNFNSTGTKTGRFSSDKPNLQNQPNNKAYPVRAAFIPRPGYKMIVADYSQIELRFMAHVSKDEIFTSAFWRGDDVHQQVADDLGITRKQAKIVNFAVLYGMTFMGLALSLKITEKKAKKIIADYESTYKGYYRWKTRVEEKVIKDKMSRTIFGRIRRMPYVNNPKMHNSALRQGVNAEVQGGAADVIKLAMIKIHKKWCGENDYGARMLMQVHDELICEAPIEHAERAYAELIYEMENCVKLDVPLLVEGILCDSWDAMKGGDVPDYLQDVFSPVDTSFSAYLYPIN